MNISNAEYTIEFLNGMYSLKLNNEILLTPNNNLVAHKQRKLIENILYELECEDELNNNTLSTYFLYSILVDQVQNDNNIIDENIFRNYILTDLILRSCAGPEKTEQYFKWGALFESLELLDIEYPDIIQNPDLDEVEKWISSMGVNYQNSLNKFIKYFYKEYSILSDVQKTAILWCTHNHGSIIYGMMLSTKKCNILDYSAAILAGHCMIPNVFLDVTREEYKESFEALKADALLISNFIDICLTPDIELSHEITNSVKNFHFLPDGAKISLVESFSKILKENSEDYSPYVMLLGKSVEITIKELVFNKFQKMYGGYFINKNQVDISFEKNDKINNLVKFLTKPPHFIELGSMLIILEKHDGRLRQENEILKSFFDFIINDLKLTSILNKSWIDLVWELSKKRNEAAHSSRFTLKEVKEIKSISTKILASF
jgi:hypothetical protein